MNEVIFLYLNQFQGQSLFLDVIIFLMSDILVLSFIVAIFIYVYTSDNHRRAIKNSTIILLAGLIAWALADIIKYIFPVGRPFTVSDSVKVFFERGGDGSFPSGHTAFISSVATMFYFYNKRIFFWMLAVVVAVGLGRVISGMHWPVDVLGGLTLGVVVALSIQYIYMRYQKYFSWAERIVFWK